MVVDTTITFLPRRRYSYCFGMSSKWETKPRIGPGISWYVVSKHLFPMTPPLAWWWWWCLRLCFSLLRFGTIFRVVSEGVLASSFTIGNHQPVLFDSFAIVVAPGAAGAAAVDVTLYRSSSSKR